MVQRHKVGRVWWGLMLIALGAILLVEQYGLFRVPGWAFLGAIGLVFAAAYAMTRNHGMLIPAGVLLGLAAGIAVEGDGNRMNGSGVLGGLGLGFVAIYAVDWLMTRSRQWWPLIPGLILVVLSGLLWTGNKDLLQLFGNLWPLGLIALGVYVLYRYWREDRAKPGTPS
jgi:hypothetical protein